MQFYVSDENSKDVRLFELNDDLTVSDVLAECDFDPDCYTLQAIADGYVIEDQDYLVSDLIDDHGDRFAVSAAVIGGKVHGSLARAGKVKGQTPKVEKAEKHKKLTGRAKRRQQYIKRFKRAVPDARGKRRR